MEISIETDIPIARGLGSSASLVICLTGGLLYSFNEKYSLNFSKGEIEETINSLGYQLEELFHGNPSGIDHMTSLKGNCVLFQKNKAMTLLPADFLDLFDLYLIDSGVPKNTKKAVK
jgi:mevalonate kinase